MKSLATLAIVTLISCGGKEEKKSNEIQIGQKPAATEAPAETATSSASDTKPSETVDLTNKGIGPIKNVELSPEIDQAMAAKGMEVYKNKAITNVRKLITEGYIKINRESQNVSVIVEKANL